jgi:hypothetical protein
MYDKFTLINANGPGARLPPPSTPILLAFVRNSVEIEEARAAAEFLKLEPALIQTKQGKTDTLDSNCFKFDD